MSGYVTGWVLKHSEVKGATRLVLLVLADHASSDGTDSWPKVETIQHEARLGARSTVQRALRDLEAAGAIAKVGTVGRGHTNWTILMGPQDAAAASGASEGPHLVPPPARASDLAVNRPTTEPPSAVEPAEQIWQHYVEVMQPRRRELDPAARATIRESLKVATAVELKRAIDGCRASTFHMGENDRGRKYNRLTQIIKGKQGIRTTREQIDLFLDIAEKAGVGDHLPSVDPARLSVAKQNVLTAWEFPGSEQAKKAGEMSAAWLAQHGYRIERDPDTGRPTFEWVSS